MGGAMDKRLMKLQSVSTTLLDIELFKLKKIAVEQNRISEALLDIQNAKRQQSIELTNTNGLEASLRAGVNTKWDAWCIQKSTSLNQERAALRVEMESQLKKTQEMFGRSDAVKTLVKRQAGLIKKKANS